MKKKNTLIVITGPTGVGKTALAIKLANAFGTEILSADSRQFYKELNIGVARPDEEELAAAKHHFIANLSIHDYYNVSRYEEDSLACLEEIFQKHRYAIMVGGSGMYIDVACNGIAELPDPDPELRKELNEELADKGLESLRAKLKIVDPEYYNNVDLANPTRIIRALEVSLQTGSPFSATRNNKAKERPFNIIKIALNLEREILNERINRRVDIMMEQGLLQEAESLYPERALTALNTVGYKELFRYFRGEISLEQAVADIKTNSRRYAKRQITWLKRYPEIVWFEPTQASDIIDYVKKQTN